MRQVGVLTAAGIVALRTMVDRLADDHANARRLAEGLAQIKGIRLDPDRIQSNIVYAEVDSSLGLVPEFISRLAQEGVKVSYPGGRDVRLVTHRHISAQDVDEALVIVARVARDGTKK